MFCSYATNTEKQLSKRVHRVVFLHGSVRSEGEGQGGQPVRFASHKADFFPNIYHTHNVSPNLKEVFQLSSLNHNVLSMTTMFL